MLETVVEPTDSQGNRPLLRRGLTLSHPLLNLTVSLRIRWFYNGFQNGFLQNVGSTTVSKTVSSRTWVWEACISRRAAIPTIWSARRRRGSLCLMLRASIPALRCLEPAQTPFGKSPTGSPPKTRGREMLRSAAPRSTCAACAPWLAAQRPPRPRLHLRLLQRCRPLASRCRPCPMFLAAPLPLAQLWSRSSRR